MAPFPEEQLNSPVGYFPGHPGVPLEGGKWIIVRKLGWGARSSTWLAVASEDSTEFQAIKIFTVAESQGSVASTELEMSKKVKGNPLLPWIQGHFYEQSPRGSHLCMRFHPLGRTVESLRASNIQGGYLPLHLVKQVATAALDSLNELHRKKIMHGAVSADHILIDAPANDDIQAAINLLPSALPQQVTDDDGLTYPVVRSQPLETPGWEFRLNERAQDFAARSIQLINLGHARRVGGQSGAIETDGFPLPPEALTGGRVGLSSDVWQLGCMIFHLATGTPLLDETYTSSPADFLTRALSNMEDRLSSSNGFATPDVPSTASLLRSCLALDPAHRPKVPDLFDHDWMKGGDVCSCGWCAENEE